MMNERTLNVLEYHKILGLLEEETSTIVGRERIFQIVPETDYAAVLQLQEETDEAVRILRLNQAIPLAHVKNIEPHIERSKLGSVLDPEAILEVAQLIYVGRHVKSFIEQLHETEPLTHLNRYAEKIVSLRQLEKDIKQKIDEHGDLYDDASPELQAIRRSIRTYETRIKEKLQQLTRTKSNMLSDTIITIRNDRYVLPVKHEYQNAFGGIVHDQSASGQTLFMEPKEVIPLNNALQHELVKEKKEIEKILRKLTEEIASFSEELLLNMKMIAAIDLIYARGKLAQKMQAVKPILNDEGIIDLKQARHPLIPPDQVVANDIKLGEDYTAIVITGPNTGGKTVTLKMIGLLTLMAQTGLHIPALEGSRLSVFQKVFADIGDEQSIEQNLSTFSSHMTNIVDMMDKIDDKTLVLFDEIGAGTDPQEGAALAMALLDEVIEKQARVVATTHYPELKAYGFNRPSVMNASVEFDVETLRPTYRLLMGVPGRSNAFEISLRLGLEKSIIERAKSYLGVDSKNVENMILALEKSRKQAERELEEAHRILEESERLHRQLKQKWEAFEQKREELYKRAEEKAKEAIDKARKEAEQIVSELRKKQTAQFKEHEWIEAKKLLDEAQPELVKQKEDENERPRREFEVGDQIRHKTLNQTGEIIEKKNEDEYVIQLGMLRVTAKKKDLQYIGKVERKEEKPITQVITTTAPVKTEIDLRGKRYEEAMQELEAYIDRAILEGYPRVTIIHGKGTGALRKGVEQFIKRSPYIKSSRYGREGEGGTGVTIVEL